MTEQIKNLKRRTRARYYRRITVQGGEMVWVRTELLPADVEGQAYYRSKGFRLEPPEGSEFALNNTEKEEVAKAKADAAEKDNLLQQQSDMLQKLSTEIANLRSELKEVKGKQETRNKGGRPRKQEVLNG